MRVFIFFIMLASALLAKNTQHKVTVGLGPYFQSQPYTEAKSLILPSPVVFFDNDLFYVRWSRLGVYFLGDKQEEFAWGLSLTAQPRTLGYKPSDAPILNGMDERKSSLEGGLALSAKYKNYYLENMLLHDLLGYYKSWLNKTEVGAEYQVGKLTMYPSFVILYFSDKFMDYYYGVKQNEATFNRPYYKANGGFEFGVQSYFKYPITENFSALINLRYDLLPQDAKNSPLTDDNYIYSGLVSVIYTFHY